MIPERVCTNGCFKPICIHKSFCVLSFGQLFDGVITLCNTVIFEAFLGQYRTFLSQIIPSYISQAPSQVSKGHSNSNTGSFQVDEGSSPVDRPMALSEHYRTLSGRWRGGRVAEWFGALAPAARAVMRGLWVRAPSLLGRAALPTAGVSVTELYYL